MDSKEAQESFFKKMVTEDGEVPFLRDIWGFFSAKGIKTRFFTVNPDASYKLDLEICESLGCPIHVLTDKDEIVQKWEVVRSTLKNRKIEEADKEKDWLQGIEKRWILPKNIVLKKAALGWNTLKEEVSAQPENRCDILKIEGRNQEERVLLYSLMDSGYCPGIILVRYTEDPDVNIQSMLVAGHLQNFGYKLADVTGNWFLYVFTDVNVYDSCSWRNTNTQNPLVHYLVEMIDTEQSKAKAKTKGPAEGTTENTPKTEENRESL